MSTPACPDLDGLLARRDEDRLSPAEERLLREHLVACGPCATRALAHDPVLLFTREASEDVLTPEARERLVGDVLAAAGAIRAGRRLGSGRRVVVLRIAASLLLAVSVAGAWLWRDGGTAGPGEEVRPVSVATEARTAPAEAFSPIEAVGGAGAVVYQFPAARPGEPTVVFVVDRNADI